MERLVHYESSVNARDTVSFEKAAIEFEKETKREEVLSCNQLIKNLLKNNLRLLKLNDIRSVLLF
ncbi:hypothetical protein DVK85_10710 [Flavobacterium arcticum]|uniref:Uncharacterized protein n=1 Tax=Flavobacterium arcticum TaxID=1784713 RepID=A0A345HDL5_9FLAO|nr:hypothetical protein [Flavobacterium arcticum]AXG74675.1 hypothetical protein DVK85_10710 [Flavobacterium arcticum]KAF2512199.1 hypothetical protein E0W72_02955 [Flavobacterium arcticum]